MKKDSFHCTHHLVLGLESLASVSERPGLRAGFLDKLVHTCPAEWTFMCKEGTPET